MSIFTICLIIISFLFSCQNSVDAIKTNSTNKFPKITCSTDKIKSIVKRIKLAENENKNMTKRKLQTPNEYEPIRIYLSTVRFEKYVEMFADVNERPLYNKTYEYLNNVISYIKKIIKVKPLRTNLKITYTEQRDFGVNVGNDYDITLSSTGVPYDLVVFVLINPGKFYSQILSIDDRTNRPIAAIINIPLEYIINSINNKKFFFESKLLHEFIHILGFNGESFQYFPGGLENTIKTEVKRGINRNFIVTPKVKEKAKLYFGCDNIIGLELEDQENVTISSHWDARILLGELMNLEQYSPEVVMSDFTLALLEDSGWYKAEYYTGGLMRFGKRKGCQFLDNDCCNGVGKTEFKNEFFDYQDDNGKPSCSSGRLSRTYCETQHYITFSNSIYERFENEGGKIPSADYCFVFDNNDNEENNGDYYIGNCKIGNGNYGSRIEYNYGRSANGLLSELHEKYSSNSFCILSETYPIASANRDKYAGVVHPMCYEMFCSNKLTVKIKDQYIVCPRQGGKVEVNGDFQGYIYCPDYNLICTGTVMCNDIFDCIDKGSTSKNSNYDYPVGKDTSSQKISEIQNSAVVSAYEEDDTGVCPINCSQCKENKKCLICRNAYNLIGEKENDDKPIICDNQINILTGYYNKNGVYYPCIEFCNKCENGDTCTQCDNFHKLDSFATCVDKVANCEEYNTNDYTCKKCKPGYAFIKEDRENCYYNIDKEKYYTLDNGISYYPCDTNIPNCEKCSQSDICSKCKDPYYFIEEDRLVCYNHLDLSKYYSKDNGISYYLCEDSITNCESCEFKYNQLSCTKCKASYYFIEDNRKDCVTDYDLTKYYTEDEGISYIPCSKGFYQCEICNNNKTKCSKCNDGYFFIGVNKERCETISDFKKYFTEDNGISYIPCDSVMEGCSECQDRYVCTLCKNSYYFVEYQRDKCYYRINLESFYKEGDAYFPCNKSIEFCNKCNVKDKCEECNTNYYFIGEDRKNCETGKNLKQYYTKDNGISYYLCSSAIAKCDECYTDSFCYICQSSYFLKYDDNKECFLETDLKRERTFYRLNSTHYRKCSENIVNCNYCSSSEECDQCLSNNYFINDNHKECVNIMDINIDEYYEYDQYNYHACSWLIDNCRKCNATDCNFCYSNYTLVNDNYKKCHLKENLKTGYYQNAKGNMYYSCIDNCDKCVNGIECIECSLNYSLLGDGTSCGACMIAELIVKDELTLENMDRLKQSYINSYKNNYDVATVYSNPDLNYTLTIFRTWQCTSLLLVDKYFKIDISDFIEKLKKKLNKSGRTFIYSLLNYNYKSYFEVYDIDLNRKIDIENECPECVRVEYEITNNYTSGISHFLGNKLSKLVYKYDINVLNSSDDYFHDSCKNLEIESLDVSIEQRRDIFYLGKNLKTITCLDEEYCTINSISYDESIGNCKCKLNFDFQFLLAPKEDSDDYDFEQNELFTPVSGINPLPIFTCSKETFDSKNLSSNVGLYIGCLVVLVQLVTFIILIVKYCIRKKIVRKIASPPPKDTLTLKKKHVFTDDTEKATQAKDKEFDEYYDNADSEKKVQDRDEIEPEDDSINSHIYRNTQILSDDNSFTNNMISDSKNRFDFDDMNPDKLSEIRQKTSDEHNDYSTIDKKSSNHSLDLSEDEIFTLIKNMKDKLELDYVVLSEAIKKDDRTLGELYCHLLPLKQPIWDMLSDIKALEINKSFVPLSMKIIRFCFMLSFNMFMNSLFLTQNYFKKRYKYFNEKYNLQYNEELKGISSAEKFGYALKYAAGYYIPIFIICLIIQFIMNYYLFNLRKQVWALLKECNDDKKEEIKQMNLFMNSQTSTYIVIATINFIFIVFFFFYIINFSQAFKGAVVDYIAGTFMTWLLLQIIPFISCFISAPFRYYGIKNPDNRLYKLNQAYIY